MDPPVAVSLNSRQDFGTVNPSYVLGPLIVSSAVAWAIWGMFTLHFVLFVREANRRRARKLRGVVTNSAPTRFDWFGRRRKQQAEEERMRSEINPWTMSFAAPSISAYPSQARQTMTVHPRQHTRHRSSKSAQSSSQDPYSPTSAGDQDSHSVLLPSHAPISDSALTSSLWIIFLASAVYILVLLRSVLSTVQFWRLAVQGWDSGSLEEDVWVGAVVADMTGPIVYILVSGYFIYALFFTGTPTGSTQARNSQRLRALSLLKHKMPSTSKVEYPASSPTSTAPTASRPGSTAGWKLAGLGSILGAAASGSASARRVDVNINVSHGPARPRGWDLFQPMLLALAALVVGICGIVEAARSLDTSMKTSTPLDAPSLIWFAGLFTFDFIMCILLSRQLHFARLWETSSWPTLVVQALFEAGGAQLLVALLSMILVVVWRADKPESTLPFVVPCILPSFSAFSALAHAARLGRMPYWCLSSGYSGRYGVSAKDLDYSSKLRRTSSRNSDIPKFELVDIEMGGVRSSRDPYEEIRPGADSGVVNLVSRPSYPRERVVDLAAAQTATSSNSNTFSSDGTGSGQGRPEDVVKQAMSVGADKEKEHERRETEAKLTGLVLERDSFGSGSGAAGTSEPPRLGKATSVMSDVSGGSAVTSLELPVFRKGRHRYSRYVNGYGYEHDWDEESEYDGQSDELTFLTSEDEGGVWDYGFSNMEREKEREERATNMAAAASGSSAVAGSSTLLAGTMSGSRRLTTVGRRISNRFSNSHPLASSSNLGEYDEATEEADTVSVLSHASQRSSRSRRRSRRSFHQFPPSHPHAQRPMPVRRLLPVVPSSSPHDTQAQAASSNHPYLHSRTVPSTRASSVDSLPPPFFAPGSPAGSVLVISRSAAREPSIAEPSIYHAASVAATRASTGSAFSTFSYTYPRPFQLPDLDVDLEAGGSLGLDSAMTMTAQPGSAFDGAMGGTAMSGASPAIAPQSPHPYATVGDTDLPPPESARRRWNVHPLKRFAEMGRLKW